MLLFISLRIKNKMKTDKITTIDELKKNLKEFVRERDWEQFHHPKDLALSLTLESTEVLELFQWNNKTLEELKKDPEFMENMKDELADVLTHTLNLCNYLEIDLSSSFEKKIEKSAKKYPIHLAKGKSDKYTKLHK